MGKGLTFSVLAFSDYVNYISNRQTDISDIMEFKKNIEQLENEM